MEENEKKEEVKVETPNPEKKEPLQEKKQDKPRTRLEKLKFTRASIDKQIEEEEKANGIVILDEEDDDKPITRRDLKRIELDNAKKTALQLTEELPEDERDQVREALESRIVASGNPQRDYQTALDLVRSEKNRQLAEEAARAGKTSKKVTRPSNTGAPRKEEIEFIPTEMELAAAAMVGKKTPEEIKSFVLKARAKEPRE